MADNFVSLHRVVTAPPEKVFRAFTEANAMASWIPPYGFLCVVHSMEVKIGGSFKMSFINFTTGNGHSFGGTYLDVKPNEFLKYTDTFDDPNLPGEMTTSVWLKEVSCGTEIKNTSGKHTSNDSYRNVLLGVAKIFRKTKEVSRTEYFG